MRQNVLVVVARWATWAGKAATAALLLAGALVSGCAQDPPDTVASIRGYRVSLEEATRLYEAGAPEGATRRWADLSPEARADFARTILDKEILIRAAKEACPTPDHRRARVWRITYEKLLLREFEESRRVNFHLKGAELERRLAAVNREAHVKYTLFKDPAVAERAYQAYKDGMGFEEAAKKFAPETAKTGPSRVAEGQMRLGSTAPLVIPDLFLADVAPGTVLPPIDTARQTFWIKLLDWRPIDIANALGGREAVIQKLDEVAYIPWNKAYIDSLKKAYAIRFHPEDDELVRERFAVFWDSLNAAGSRGETIDYQALTPPRWLFNAEEGAKPIFDLGGKTWTIHDFVQSLANIDLDYWPTIGPIEKTRYQIAGRVMRLMFFQEAEKTGVNKRPAIVDRMKRVEELGLLDQFRETLSKRDPSEDELRAYFDKESSRYTTGERIVFGVMTFPLELEGRAKEVLAKLSSGDPVLWYELGPAEQKRDPRVQFVADTKAIDPEGEAPQPGWEPFMPEVRKLEAGQVAGPIHTPDGVTLLRVSQRQHKRPLSYEQARAFALRDFLAVQADSEIDRILNEKRKRAGIKIYEERLRAAN